MSRTIPAVILAGGRATRMGGGDKGLRRVGGKRLIDLVIQRLALQCAPLALNANGDPARFADLDLPVLADSIPGQPGPLAGVLAGLDWAHKLRAAHVVTVAADTPFFPLDLVECLWKARGPSGLALAATRNADGVLLRHPVFGLWPVALRHDLTRALREGLRKIVLWTDRHGTGVAEFSSNPLDPFFNINTPGDIAAAEALAAREEA